MALSLAMIIILGLLASIGFQKIKLPGLLGMLITGILLGPYVFDVMDPSLLNVSDDLRQIALIIILLRAGLGLSKKELHSVGKTVFKLSCIPGLIEGLTIAFVSTMLLGFSFVEGGILGFIIAAVSPAVVVPFMLDLKERNIGTNKGIPTLILASASIDDVMAITIFSTFLGLYSGSQVNIGIQLFSIPISIILGLLSGLIIGIVLIILFNRYHIRDSKKVLIILAFSILLIALENLLKSKVEIAGLLGVMAIGVILLEKKPEVAKRLSAKFNKIWIFAEIILFVLVGAQVNIQVALEAGLKGILIIGIGLIGRSVGVLLSTIGSNLNKKERLFAIIAYSPKATVQAAIGSIPLALGIVSGDIILAIAVMSILITAPLGAIGIKVSSTKLLDTMK